MVSSAAQLKGRASDEKFPARSLTEHLSLSSRCFVFAAAQCWWRLCFTRQGSCDVVDLFVVSVINCVFRQQFFRGSRR